MKLPEQINLEEVSNWTDMDVEKVRVAYDVECVKDVIELWENNSIVRIADTQDFKYAYEDYMKSYPVENCITYEEFLEEINKGYGNSGAIEIARLLVLSNGIYYDNEYC